MTCDAGQVCVQTAFQGGSHLSCHGPPQPSGVKQPLTSGAIMGLPILLSFQVISVSPALPVNQKSGIQS